MAAHATGSLVETRRRLRAVPVVVVLGSAVLAEAAVLVGGTRVVGWVGLALVVVASAAWALAMWDDRIEARPALVVGAIALAFLIAVAVPPRQSRDVWSYAAYGRMVSVHHVSPYVHTPRDFALDPFFARVGTGWRDAHSVYGPLFTDASAGATRLAGDSALRVRLAFQGLAALALAAALLLVWRTTKSARALVFVGLQPAVVLNVVNGGHNDALVGLAVLGGVLLAARRRWSWCGVVLALGILVKASAGLGLLGIAVWAFRRDRRGAIRLVLTTGAVALLMYVPAGTAAVRAVAGAGNGNTKASVWDPVSSLVHPSMTLAFVVVLLLAVAAAVAWRDEQHPSTPAVATNAAYLLGGAYVLPWYPVWALPTAALERRSSLAVLVGIQAAFLTAAYEFELPAHPTLDGFAAVARTGIIQIVAWSALAAFVVLLVRARRNKLSS